MFEDYTCEDINFPKILSMDDVCGLDFIPRKENLILYGNVGAGKTHLATALGIAACDRGFKTKFWRTAVLVNKLIEAKQQGCLGKFMEQFDIHSGEINLTWATDEYMFIIIGDIGEAEAVRIAVSLNK
ncbi:MAG: ATP-binding protein [Oscillospiraceae bacterium]|nr:ATP-binding protein [Oscillospiraceae bacterium]